jgi:AraC-like DNA-binding protein
MDNTSAVTAEGGFDQWHEVTCRNYSLSECDRTVSHGFRARISSCEFGPLSLSDAFQTERVRMTRGPMEIRKDQRDHFMLYLVMQGRIDVSQADRQIVASPGDLFLYDQTMPFSLDFHQPHAILVNVPRALLVSRVPTVQRLTARRISGASKMGALMGSLVQQMSAFDDVTRSHVADRLATSAMDILATALESEFAGDQELQRERHRMLPKVESYILAHLHEEGLDLESIARAQNIAPRTLSRIFAAEGTTPIRWLWQQRLAASYKALSEGRVDNVTDAAVSSGFTDMSHFSRAFKREFGCLPHMVRRTHSTDVDPR